MEDKEFWEAIDRGMYKICTVGGAIVLTGFIGIFVRIIFDMIAGL